MADAIVNAASPATPSSAGHTPAVNLTEIRGTLVALEEKLEQIECASEGVADAAANDSDITTNPIGAVIVHAAKRSEELAERARADVERLRQMIDGEQPAPTVAASPAAAEIGDSIDQAEDALCVIREALHAIEAFVVQLDGASSLRDRTNYVAAVHALCERVATHAEATTHAIGNIERMVKTGGAHAE